MNLFQKIKTRRPRLNKFDLSHERKLSCNMGNLIPIYLQDIVPGDKFRVNTEIMLRMAPMLAPVMHRVHVYTHYFFVPNRLIWSEWEDFITGGREGTSMPVMPYLVMGNNENGHRFGVGSLADHLGLPPIDGTGPDVNTIAVSSLPFRAYQLIYDEYYRDQNLEASLDIPLTSGAETLGNYAKLTSMRQRAWEKDYFTSALPWAQRGPAVEMPMEATGTVTYKNPAIVLDLNGDPVVGDGLLGTDDQFTPGILKIDKQAFNDDGNGGTIDNIDSVNVDGSGVSINDLRRSIRLQEWLEKNARGGARYIEQILSHFGVVSSDARLQRPEYLGGGKTPVSISEVLSTFQDSAGEGSPQGNMAGHGVSVGKTNGFGRRFEEHGYVIGIMSVLPVTAYQQGVPRHFRKFDKFDHYWPEFANIGEQEVKQSEIYFNQALEDNDETFGYQSRYAEYKYMPSTVHGEFRTTLDYWHMGRKFASKPVLNANFVKSDPTTRIFNVADPATEHLYVYAYNNVNALRPMPYYGTPIL